MKTPYIDLVQSVLNHGTLEDGRNGKTLVCIGKTMRFSLENKMIPLLTTKRVAWKTCLRELLWFVKGFTNNKMLKEQNVKIWNANASREFLDSRNLYHLKEDDLGPIYGHQWRYYNAAYTNCNANYTGKGVDQLGNIIKSLKEGEYSRRMIMCAWNPCQINEMALPPCHVLVQFHVTEGKKLSCSLYQRSGDIGLGVPFNIASYSFLTHLLAHHCNLEAKEFVHHIGNAHIYDDHVESLKTQIKRKPYEYPKLKINKLCDKIEDYTLDNFEIENYKYHPAISMKMRV